VAGDIVAQQLEEERQFPEARPDIAGNRPLDSGVPHADQGQEKPSLIQPGLEFAEQLAPELRSEVQSAFAGQFPTLGREKPLQDQPSGLQGSQFGQSERFESQQGDQARSGGKMGLETGTMSEAERVSRQKFDEARLGQPQSLSQPQSISQPQTFESERFTAEKDDQPRLGQAQTILRPPVSVAPSAPSASLLEIIQESKTLDEDLASLRLHLEEAPDASVLPGHVDPEKGFVAPEAAFLRASGASEETHVRHMGPHEREFHTLSRSGGLHEGQMREKERFEPEAEKPTVSIEQPHFEHYRAPDTSQPMHHVEQPVNQWRGGGERLPVHEERQETFPRDFTTQIGPKHTVTSSVPLPESMGTMGATGSDQGAPKEESREKEGKGDALDCRRAGPRDRSGAAQALSQSRRDGGNGPRISVAVCGLPWRPCAS